MIADIGKSSAIAGIGIVRKIDSLAYSVNQGIAQGMLPIVSYCFACHKYKRMKSVIFFSAACSLSFSLICTTTSYLFAPELIKIFINDADTIYYRSQFLRILCIAVSIYSVVFVIAAVFQSVGESIQPFILSLVNRGSIDIVLFFVVNHLFGSKYILWVTPIMSSIALILGIILFLKFFRCLNT